MKCEGLLSLYVTNERPPRSTRTDHSFPTRRSSDLLEHDAIEQVLKDVSSEGKPIKFTS